MKTLELQSELTITGKIAGIKTSPGFDNTSVHMYEREETAFHAWDKGPGHDVPNNWLHKGQEAYDSERHLLDHLNSEFVNLNGMVAEYYVTTYDKKYDLILGEDNQRRYIRKFDFMFFTDEMYEPDISNNPFGMWSDNSNTMDVAKIGFLAASTNASSGDTEYIDIKSGFTTNEDYVFDEYEPKIGDFVKVKSVGLWYEISSIKNRYTSLQGSSFWQITIIPMKKNNNIEVSDEAGQADVMENIDNVDKQRQEDLDLFNLNDQVDEMAKGVIYEEKEIEEPTAISDRTQDDRTGVDGWF
jgi:hypothetical protein